MNTNLLGKTLRCYFVGSSSNDSIRSIVAAATIAFAISDAYKKGWNMACGDDMNMTQFKATAPHVGS